MTIRFFSKHPEYSWLSNFSEHGFTLDGLHWPSVEHYYQAQKYTDLDVVERIRNAKTPQRARKAGKSRSLEPRPDWNAVKEQVMRKAVLAKFEQNRELRSLLLATQQNELVHQSGADMFWGQTFKGEGENRLGVIIMEDRRKLQREGNAD